MKGSELKKRIAVSDKTAKEIYESWGISKQAMHDLYRKDDIGEYYEKKAKESGLMEVDLGQDQSESIPFTAAHWYKMWEKSEKERQALSKALVELVDTHNQVLKKKFKLVS